MKSRKKYKEVAELEIKRGKPPKGKKPEKKELERLYLKERNSIREIADILGCSKDMIYRALGEYRIERRSKTRKSQLEKFELVDLRRRAKEKGIRGLARELGINHGTLLHFLKKNPE